MLLAVLASVLAGCATATVIPVGNARAPVDPSQVRLYAQPPPHYEVLGLITGNSNYEGSGQNGVSDMVAKIKEQAAKLGANGVLLGKMAQQYLGSSGGATYLGWGVFNSASMAAYSQTMQAQAIYVPPEGQSSAYADQDAGNGAWPLQLPQFDIRASCQTSGGNAAACINAENAAHSWLMHHTTTVQIAGDCSMFAQQTQSYTMIQACVQQRERH
jgi:hypothetical protein